MKILLINKFLHPNGGAETYVFRLGEALKKLGHEVQYFGMEHEDRMVGNRMNAYTANMDFRHARITQALKVIYSPEARRKIRMVLNDFRPDICHLNNFNYQLTPSILLEICKWRRETGRICKIFYTAHDYQLVCPNHMCRSQSENCEACLNGHVWNCLRHKCIHDSLAKSLIGALEAAFWRRLGVYRYIDIIICCSRFMKSKLDRHPHLAGRTVVMHNFVPKVPQNRMEPGDYVLYFGRFTREKGVATLAEAAKALPQIPFVFAGNGELTAQLEGIPNIRNAGFQTGEALETLISHARFTVCPSEWYENCSFSVMESLSHGVPVLGAKIGGIPELISPGENGALFESGNGKDLKEKLKQLWETPIRCESPDFMAAEEYAQKLLTLYKEGAR